MAVTPEGDILIGAWNTSVNGIEGAGHVYLFDGDTGNLLLDIPNPEPEFAQFGWSVAAMSGRIVVGAQAGTGGSSSFAGSVFVFASVPEPSTISLGAIIFGIMSVRLRRRTLCVFSFRRSRSRRLSSCVSFIDSPVGRRNGSERIMNRSDPFIFPGVALQTYSKAAR